MSGPLLSLLLGIQLQAPGICPGADEIHRYLLPILPSQTARSASDVATVEEHADGTLTLTLGGADSGIIAARVLPPSPTCSEQAETVAVTLAVWEAQIHPEISLHLDGLASAPIPARAAPPMSDSATARSRPVAARSPTSAELAVGAGIIGAWQPGSYAPGARLDAMLGNRGSPWRKRMSIVGLGEHTTSLPPGHATWWRLDSSLGADLSITFGRRQQWAAVAEAGLLLGMVRVAGSGYQPDSRSSSLDVGAEASARIDWRGGKLIRPWLGLTLATWVRAQRVEVTGAAAGVKLPWGEPMLALGADFFLGQ